MPARPNRFQLFFTAGIISDLLDEATHKVVMAAAQTLSVVLAAFAGWKMLDEGDHRRRITSAAIVLVGLAVLVAGG